MLNKLYSKKFIPQHISRKKKLKGGIHAKRTTHNSCCNYLFICEEEKGEGENKGRRGDIRKVEKEIEMARQIRSINSCLYYMLQF
jgi:hypothetical protein